MSTYVEDAVVIVDNEYETRILVEPGYRDDRDRDCVRLLLEVKGARGELRVAHEDVRLLAHRLLEMAYGRKLKVSVRKVRE